MPVAMSELDIGELSSETLRYLTQASGGPIGELWARPGDWLRFRRWKRAIERVDEARRILAERARQPRQVPDDVLVPLLEAASLSEDESIAAKWATLLANATDPAVDAIPRASPTSSASSRRTKRAFSTRSTTVTRSERWRSPMASVWRAVGPWHSTTSSACDLRPTPSSRCRLCPKIGPSSCSRTSAALSSPRAAARARDRPSVRSSAPLALRSLNARSLRSSNRSKRRCSMDLPRFAGHSGA